MISRLPTGAIYWHVSYRLRELQNFDIYVCKCVKTEGAPPKRERCNLKLCWRAHYEHPSQRVLIHSMCYLNLLIWVYLFAPLRWRLTGYPIELSHVNAQYPRLPLQRVRMRVYCSKMVGWVLAKVCLLVGPTEDKSMVILFHNSWHCSVNFISAEVNRSLFLLLTIEGTHWLMQICGTYWCLSLIGKGTGVNMNTPTSFFNFFFFYCLSFCFNTVIILENNYLAIPGLGFGRQSLRSSLWSAGCSAASCELLIAACGT